MTHATTKRRTLDRIGTSRRLGGTFLLAAAMLAWSAGCENTSSSSSQMTPAHSQNAPAENHPTPTPASQQSGAQTKTHNPGLAVGDHAPDAKVLDRNGKTVSLANLYKNGPIVLTFYRGGWCPFCNRALSSWHDKMPELTKAGGTFIAITAENPDHAADTTAKHDLSFAVYSDTTMAAAKAYKVFFNVDAATKRKYTGFGIDLASWNGSHQWSLPAPGTFVIDRNGIVRYAWAKWDYKQRADPDEVIAAVKALH